MKINLEENCIESCRHQNQRKFSVFLEVLASTVILVLVVVLVLMVMVAVEEEFRAGHYPDYIKIVPCQKIKENFCQNFRVKNRNLYQIQDLISMSKGYAILRNSKLHTSKLIAFC